jgi:hypothetical protein
MKSKSDFFTNKLCANARVELLALFKSADKAPSNGFRNQFCWIIWVKGQVKYQLKQIMLRRHDSWQSCKAHIQMLMTYILPWLG